MGRLADFIHVEEGWEEAIAHALDAFSGAIVVPGERNLLHALRKAKQDRLGKAVLVMSDAAESGAGAPEQVAVAEENDGSPYRTPCAPGTMVSANPDAPNPGRAAGVVGAVRLLLNDVVAVETMDEAVRMVHDGGWAQAITRDGEVVNPVGAVGGSSLSQSDLSLAARRDKALKRITVLQGQLDDITRQVGEARQRRDRGASAGRQGIAAAHSGRSSVRTGREGVALGRVADEGRGTSGRGDCGEAARQCRGTPEPSVEARRFAAGARRDPGFGAETPTSTSWGSASIGWKPR